MGHCELLALAANTGCCVCVALGALNLLTCAAAASVCVCELVSNFSAANRRERARERERIATVMPAEFAPASGWMLCALPEEPPSPPPLLPPPFASALTSCQPRSPANRLQSADRRISPPDRRSQRTMMHSSCSSGAAEATTMIIKIGALACCAAAAGMAFDVQCAVYSTKPAVECRYTLLCATDGSR